MGGYPVDIRDRIIRQSYGLLLAGVYTTPDHQCEVKGVFTNTVPVTLIRRRSSEATFLRERLVDYRRERDEDRQSRNFAA